ncbi:MAG: GtrA family protein [Acidimicrobiales bacterium]
MSPAPNNASAGTSTLSGRLSSLWVDHGLRMVRYGGLSVFNVVMGQSLLLFFLKVMDLTAIPANLCAVGVGTLPSYLLARKYVWAKTGKHSLTKEVLPFWTLNLLGLVMSTVAVHLAASASHDNAIAVSAASIGAWFGVWVAKYLLLDRRVFAGAPAGTAEPVRV